jgi:DNA repair photolyase
MKRAFLSYTRGKCKNECLYCFGRWNIEHANFDCLTDFNENIIIYPLCDNDISDLEDSGAILDYLEKCLSIQSKYSIISVSTKTDLPLSFIEQVRNINRLYVNRGFIKLSVSFSSKNYISVLEPGSASYRERISLLKNISEYSIPTSVILKPILPFVDIREYFELVSDINKYTNAVILGDLYVDSHDKFYKEYIQNKYTVTERKVSWLKNLPVWSVVESTEIIGALKNYISSIGIKHYDSDSEHLCSIMGTSHDS